jgi:hypothetical protein
MTRLQANKYYETIYQMALNPNRRSRDESVSWGLAGPTGSNPKGNNGKIPHRASLSEAGAYGRHIGNLYGLNGWGGELSALAEELGAPRWLQDTIEWYFNKPMTWILGDPTKNLPNFFLNLTLLLGIPEILVAKTPLWFFRNAASRWIYNFVERGITAAAEWGLELGIPSRVVAWLSVNFRNLNKLATRFFQHPREVYGLPRVRGFGYYADKYENDMLKIIKGSGRTNPGYNRDFDFNNWANWRDIYERYLR